MSIKSFRLKALNPIKLNNKLLGGDYPLICIPIIGSNKKLFLNNIKRAVKYKPDIIELRIDSLKKTPKLPSFIREVRNIIGKIPIILTNRIKREGGFKFQDEYYRINSIIKAINTGEVNIVDIELNTKYELRNKVINQAKNQNVYVIISYHNFRNTPSIRKLMLIGKSEIEAGADIVKIVTYANSIDDIMRMMNFIYKFKLKFKKPLISMCMGELGSITRFFSSIIGSDLIFACLPNAPSAPGQIDIENLRLINRLIGVYHER